MMCMAAGFDIVLIFIGLELMAISTYVLVGFLRRDRRSNEAALKYLAARRVFFRHFRLRPLAALRSYWQHQPGRNRSFAHANSRQGPAQSHRDRCPADHDHRLAVQSGRRSVPPVGAGRLRRRTHLHHRIHVRRRQSRRMGHAAAHPALWGFMPCGQPGSRFWSLFPSRP